MWNTGWACSLNSGQVSAPAAGDGSGKCSVLSVLISSSAPLRLDFSSTKPVINSKYTSKKKNLKCKRPQHLLP